MPKFVMLSTLGPDGHATLREHPERLRQVNHDVEAMGVKVLQQYALLGPYDFLNILEAPDEVTMAKVATTLASRGTLKTLTLHAIEVDDFIAAMGRGTGRAEPT
ncbi:GYD domain-containing protein [soil metagenome]